MRYILAIFLFSLCACGASSSAPPLLQAFDDFSCPRLPEDSGYSVQAQLGPDYTICSLTPLQAGLLRAEIRVGGHWSLPDDSRFAGFSTTPIGQVAWFYGVRENSVHERLAFLPTGLARPSDVLLVIYGGSLQEATRQRELVLATVVRASMRPNNSVRSFPSSPGT